MKTLTYSQRDKQSHSATESLQELQCTMPRATDRNKHLTLLGTDRKGLIRQGTVLTVIELAAIHGKQVAAWGWRRLELLFRNSILNGKKARILGRLLLFGNKKSAHKPGNLVSILRGRMNRSHHLTTALKTASMAVVTGMVLSSPPTDANAMDIIFTEPANFPMHDVDVGFNSVPAFVDIDGDGDYDAFIGEFDGTINYFENAGTNISPAFTQQFGAANPLNGIDVGLSSAPTFVDIDSDGDFDAFIGELVGTVKYYENTGTSASPVFIERIGNANPLSSVDLYNSIPTFVDIDGDGDFDAFIGENSGTVHYLENTGTNTSPAFIEGPVANPLFGIDIGIFSAPTFVDIDGDGDFDAFIGEGAGTVNYFENTGTKTAPDFIERTGAANPLNGTNVKTYYSIPTFVDIDGDGDFDAFIGELAGTVNYFENTGAKTAPVFIERPVTVNPLHEVDVGDYSTPTFIDIDDDGDSDALVGERSGTINYHENTGSNTKPAFIERVGAPNPMNGFDVGDYSSPTFVDIDGDGDFDAFIGEYYGTINYFENTGTKSIPAFVERTGSANPLNGIDIGVYSIPTFIDIDDDGDFDAFIGEDDGTVNYFENTGSNTSPAFIGGPIANPLAGIDVGFYSAPTFVDIDGDGDFDVFIGEHFGTVKYHENTGTRSTPAFSERTGAANPLNGFDVGSNSSPTFTDIDGDGDFDAFIGEDDGTVKYFRNDTPKKFPWSMFLPAVISHNK